MIGNKGTTLSELMVTVAVVGIISLGVGSALVFGVTQFNSIQEENTAQIRVQQAAFYLRLFMSNALKAQCAGSPGPPAAILNPVTLVNTTAINGFPPAGPTGVRDGLIDCRSAVVWPSTAPTGAPAALGVFFRENSAYTSALTSPNVKAFQGVGVYYQAPNGTDNNQGNLIFSTQGAAAAVGSKIGAITVDHLSNIQVLSYSTAPVLNGGVTYNMLQSITYQITARYVSGTGIRDYSPAYTASTGTPGYATVNDIIEQVQIAFHDNYLGSDLSNPSNPTSERLNGGIYYYKFNSPLITN